jgi:hypothetical protein
VTPPLQTGAAPVGGGTEILGKKTLIPPSDVVLSYDHPRGLGYQSEKGTWHGNGHETDPAPDTWRIGVTVLCVKPKCRAATGALARAASS